MTGPVETLSYIARRLIQYEQKFANAELPRRRAACQLLTQISQSLHSLLEELSRDKLPHDACRELVLYSTRLAETVEEEVGRSEADRLAAALEQAGDKEKIYREFHGERRDYLTEELEKAAILIQALANGIYASPAQTAPAGADPASPA